MAETGEPHTQRPQYPPSEEHGSGQYYNQGSPRGPPAPPRDERSAYPPPQQQQGPPPPPPPPPQGQPQDPNRQAQYPPGPYPPDPRAQGHYAPPPPGPYGPPPPGYPYDPNHPPQGYHYPYPPGPPHGQGPPQPTQPDPWRLPPPVPPYYHQGYGYPPPQAPAPRQRTAIACKYCRKRKIRCSGYDSASDGRCANCVRFNQECLFHPVSSQTTFVPASAVYGPNGVGRGQPQQLYGAHGQPLGPAAGQGPPSYQYPPPGQYPPQPYSPAGPPPYGQQQGPPPQGQGYSQAPEGENSNVRKRGPPDDDPHNEGAHASSQSPHPSSKPRTSLYEPRSNSNGGYEHNGEAPTSPAGSAMSYQSHPAASAPHQYANGQTNGHQNTNSPPAGLTPQSAHTPGGSFNSPHALPIRDDGKASPQPGSAGSSTNGRNGMSIHDMVGGPSHGGADQRARNDVDALKKLDGKK